MSFLTSLYAAPEVNPLNNKARSLPFLNPINVYGRVFHFAWFGFMIAFWSWYAFPPLLSDVIAGDVHMLPVDVANSNIIGLCATLLVRLIAGPCCDRYGPRKVFAATLLIGALPTFLAGTATTKNGIFVLRFFIGILGGSFVPCQVWTTAFYDNHVVGTANALTAGFGNAGGGITYFVMPAVFNSLVHRQHLTPHVAWRVAFVVPGILIVSVALALLLLCPDTPTGKWSERETAVADNMRRHSMIGTAAFPGELSTEKDLGTTVDSPSLSEKDVDRKDVLPGNPNGFADHEAHLTAEQMMDTAKGEVIRKPNAREIAHVFLSPQSFVTAACYFCSFGAELAINGILGQWYMAVPTFGARNRLTLQEAGNWAAMFGLLNVVFRPLGGFVADIAYRTTGSVWSKKALLHSYGLLTGMFLIIIGKVNPHHKAELFGLIAGMAFFLEGGNGINFALVPHVHPFANGVISGLTGASGNLGGIIFAIIFRYHPGHFGTSMWIIGLITILMNAAVAWIPPIPKGQIGGY